MIKWIKKLFGRKEKEEDQWGKIKIGRVKLEKGDILMINFMEEVEFAQEEMDIFSNRLKEFFPQNKICIVWPEIQLQVVGQEEFELDDMEGVNLQ